nr:MAG TPA: ubiquitin thioesterase [Caudoviricetes sp.]
MKGILKSPRLYLRTCFYRLFLFQFLEVIQ